MNRQQHFNPCICAGAQTSRKVVVDLKQRLNIMRSQGYDVDNALHRMLDDESFYLKLLKTFFEDSNIPVLEKAMIEQDYTTAFEASHKLKGSAVTLGLTPIVASFSKILDDLRTSPPSPSLQSHYRQARTALYDCLHLLQDN